MAACACRKRSPHGRGARASSPLSHRPAPLFSCPATALQGAGAHALNVCVGLVEDEEDKAVLRVATCGMAAIRAGVAAAPKRFPKANLDKLKCEKADGDDPMITQEQHRVCMECENVRSPDCALHLPGALCPCWSAALQPRVTALTGRPALPVGSQTCLHREVNTQRTGNVPQGAGKQPLHCAAATAHWLLEVACCSTCVRTSPFCCCSRPPRRYVQGARASAHLRVGMQGCKIYIHQPGCVRSCFTVAGLHSKDEPWGRLDSRAGSEAISKRGDVKLKCLKPGCDGRLKQTMLERDKGTKGTELWYHAKWHQDILAAEEKVRQEEEAAKKEEQRKKEEEKRAADEERKRKAAAEAETLYDAGETKMSKNKRKVRACHRACCGRRSRLAACCLAALAWEALVRCFVICVARALSSWSRCTGMLPLLDVI